MDRGGGYQDFPSALFCLTVPKNFVEDSLTVAVILGTLKSLDPKSGSIKNFRGKFLVSQCRN